MNGPQPRLYMLDLYLLSNNISIDIHVENNISVDIDVWPTATSLYVRSIDVEQQHIYRYRC